MAVQTLIKGIYQAYSCLVLLEFYTGGVFRTLSNIYDATFLQT